MEIGTNEWYSNMMSQHSRVFSRRNAAISVKYVYIEKELRGIENDYMGAERKLLAKILS